MISRPVLLALLLLTVLGLGIRLVGLGHGLPHSPEPDAYLVDQARLHRAGVIKTAIDARNYAKYPHLLSRAFTLVPLPDDAAVALDEELARAARPYWNGRLVVALLASLLVPATFFLARRFLESGWALLAAALVATSLLHAEFSWQARPHGPLATFTTLSLLASLRLARAPTVRNVLLAGAAAGLAVACLHNGVLVIPALVVAFLVGARAKDSSGGVARARLLWGLVPAVPLCLFAYPFLVPALRNALPLFAADRTGLEPVFPHQAGIHWNEWINGGGFVLMGRYGFSFDPALTALALLGVVVGIAAVLRARSAGERRGDLLVVASAALPYFLLLGSFERTYERFLLPLLPVAACLAVFPLRALARAVGSRGAAVALSILALAFPTAVVAKAALLRTRPDTETRLAEWIEKTLDPERDALIAIPAVSYPIPFRIQAERGDNARRVHNLLPWSRYLTRHPRADRVDFTVFPASIAVDDLQRRGATKARAELRRRMSEIDARHAILLVRPGRPEYEQTARVLNALGRRVHRVSPYADLGDGALPTDRGRRQALGLLESAYGGASYDVWALAR